MRAGLSLKAAAVIAIGLVAAFVAADLRVWAEPAGAEVDAGQAAKVRRLISQGGYYYSIGRFDKAIESADEALKLDPDSAAARELKQISADAISERDEKNRVSEKGREFEAHMRDINRAMVPQRELLREGPDWPLVKQRTGGVYGPAADINEANREINAKLDSVLVNADFKGTSLREAAAFLVNTSKLNIQVDPRAQIDGKPAGDAEVTFQARSMKLRNVIAWITRLNGLGYTVRDEVVLITDKARLEELKVTAVYDISDITAPIPDYSSVPEFDMTLPAINARVIGDGFYRVPTYWQLYGAGPYTGTYFADFAQQDRYFMTEEEVKRLIDALIEGEEKK